jgi:hypothetical protein
MLSRTSDCTSKFGGARRWIRLTNARCQRSKGRSTEGDALISGLPDLIPRLLVRLELYHCELRLVGQLEGVPIGTRREVGWHLGELGRVHEQPGCGRPRRKRPATPGTQQAGRQRRYRVRPNASHLAPLFGCMAAPDVGVATRGASTSDDVARFGAHLRPFERIVFACGGRRLEDFRGIQVECLQPRHQRRELLR